MNIYRNESPRTALTIYWSVTTISPDLRLPEESRPIGRWGRMHRDYLKEWRPVLYNDLLLSGRFWTYLADLNEQAQNQVEVITEQMKAASMLPFRNWTKPCCTV